MPAKVDHEMTLSRLWSSEDVGIVQLGVRPPPIVAAPLLGALDGDDGTYQGRRYEELPGNGCPGGLAVSKLGQALAQCRDLGVLVRDLGVL
jgi:hypothetical protein